MEETLLFLCRNWSWIYCILCLKAVDKVKHIIYDSIRYSKDERES